MTGTSTFKLLNAAFPCTGQELDRSARAGHGPDPVRPAAIAIHQRPDPAAGPNIGTEYPVTQGRPVHSQFRL